MSILFYLMFFLVIGVFCFVLVSNIAQWGKNNASPRLTVDALIVAKREQVTHHHHQAGEGMHVDVSTSYYVTFQVESGDRMELHVNGREYGMLAEGDRGRLSFQGTRYLRFERSGTPEQ